MDIKGIGASGWFLAKDLKFKHMIILCSFPDVIYTFTSEEGEVAEKQT